jgi:hypothetical protein
MMRVADIAVSLGGDFEDLPVGYFRGEPIVYRDLVVAASALDHIVLADVISMLSLVSNVYGSRRLRIHDYVVCANSSLSGHIAGAGSLSWPSVNWRNTTQFYRAAQAIAEAWKLDVDELLDFKKGRWCSHERVEIGTDAGGTVSLHGHVLRRG